jgi:hypothetical protein
MAGKYAADTEVSSERSQAEIKATLQRYGASKYAYYEDEGRAGISCEIQSRRLKFILLLPNRTSEEFVYAGEGNRRKIRDVETQHRFWEKACRQKWRALALIIKGKLEALESNIYTFDEVFMSDILLPDGKTVGEHMKPQIEHAYLSGKMPKLLPGFGETGEWS